MKKVTYHRLLPSGPVEEKDATLSPTCILEEAEKLGIQWKEIPGTYSFELMWNGQTQYFKSQLPSSTSNLGYFATLHKAATRAFLQYKKISIPKGFFLLKSDPQNFWLEMLHQLTLPVVVKPSHGGHGDSVFVNISNEEEYVKAVGVCFSYSNDPEHGVVVEEMFTGKEYRILATKEKVIGIINRVPANVIGDGKSTIQKLIEKKNIDQRRGEQYEKALLKIKIDDALISFLTQQGLSLENIPPNGDQIFLRGTSNLSTGGDSIDVTDIAHSSVKEIALGAVNAIPGLALAGIDFMTKDITSIQTPESYSIIEMNSSPMISMHDFPYEGKKRDAAKEFLFLLFPELKR